MDLKAAGLKEQPFKTHGKPLPTVSYASHDRALAALADVYTTTNGHALLQGPALSGKSTLIRRFADSLEDDYPVAVVNGKGLNNGGLLEAALQQFGYAFEHSTPNELLGMMRVFAMQQTVSHDPPLLIVENAHLLYPSAMQALAELAAIHVRGTSALKLVLVSDRPLRARLDVPQMEPLTRRLRHDLHLYPMTLDEARQYLHAKLSNAGSPAPEFLFPNEVCDELWSASGGWPGVLDRLSLLALARAQTLPVRVENIERPVLPHGTWDEAEQLMQDDLAPLPADPPKLFVSFDGETIRELVFDRQRLLIGRSEHNDIAISSHFISRHHALLVRHGESTFLMDLNSTNGTWVNSQSVSIHLLTHDDVITIGHHRIKFKDPNATKRVAMIDEEFSDTVVMESMEDRRRILAQENTAVLPVQSENLPTAGH